MANVLVKRVNRFGIPAIRNVGATLSDTRLTITFASHPNVSDAFQGFFVAYISNLPAAPDDAVPVFLATEGYLGSDKQLYTSQSEVVTTDVVAEGVYLCFYDSTSDKLRVML